MDICSFSNPHPAASNDAMSFQNIAVRVAAGSPPVEIETLPTLSTATPEHTFIRDYSLADENGNPFDTIMVNPAHPDLASNPVSTAFKFSNQVEKHHEAYQQQYGSSYNQLQTVTHFNEYTGNALKIPSTGQMDYLDTSHFSPQEMIKMLQGEEGSANLNVALRAQQNLVETAKQEGLDALTTRRMEDAGEQYNVSQRAARDVNSFKAWASQNEIPFFPADRNDLSNGEKAIAKEAADQFYGITSALRNQFLELNPGYTIPEFKAAMDANIAGNQQYPQKLYDIASENDRRMVEGD
jgi:hypothetical protein